MPLVLLLVLAAESQLLLGLLPMHKASGPATGNTAATTPGLLLRGLATLLLPDLYHHM